MYLDFYGLKEKPFNATPDPKFLYLTPTHREALAQLLYSVQEDRGFLVLTGEVGTGKTTLLQTLLSRLDGKMDVAYIFSTRLSFDGILEYILKDLGIDCAAATQAHRLFALNTFLMERHRAGQNVGLILDEAQNLEPETLEEIRLLSNLETPTKKLLQILLVGQPELKLKLNFPELRQLKQRIGLRCHIQPLTPEESHGYIRHRLKVAGARDLTLFTDQAVKRISEYARGIPRMINIVCDHCLLIGYADQTRKINQKAVEQAIKYLEDGEIPMTKRVTGIERARPGLSWLSELLRWALTVLAIAALGGGALVALAWYNLLP